MKFIKQFVLSSALSLSLSLFVLSGCGDNGAGGGGGGGNNNGGGGGGGSDYVSLGGLKWMKKNLNIETADSWCYENSTANCDKYGRLYTWSAAKKACQSAGMRLPTNQEWEALVTEAGGSEAGKKLKSTSGWKNDGGDVKVSTDNYGFTALPGGFRDAGYSTGYSYSGYAGYWWTATESGSGEATTRYMNANSDIVVVSRGDTRYGQSVRCVKPD
jgi:uncharacterized protein (TIGR02145 family)